MSLVRLETSPCVMLVDEHTGRRSSCIAYWWASLDRMTAQSETRNPSQNEVETEAVTAVAVVVWFSVFTLSLNKTGLALCPCESQSKAGREGRKEGRERRKDGLTPKETEEEAPRRRQEGCTSTRDLIMHGRACGAREGKSDGWSGEEEITHLLYTEGWGAGREAREGQRD